jgi:hypothetical protein
MTYGRCITCYWVLNCVRRTKTDLTTPWHDCDRVRADLDDKSGINHEPSMTMDADTDDTAAIEAELPLAAAPIARTFGEVNNDDD